MVTKVNVSFGLLLLLILFGSLHLSAVVYEPEDRVYCVGCAFETLQHHYSQAPAQTGAFENPTVGQMFRASIKANKDNPEICQLLRECFSEKLFPRITSYGYGPDRPLNEDTKIQPEHLHFPEFKQVTTFARTGRFLEGVGSNYLLQFCRALRKTLDICNKINFDIRQNISCEQLFSGLKFHCKTISPTPIAVRYISAIEKSYEILMRLPNPERNLLFHKSVAAIDVKGPRETTTEELQALVSKLPETDFSLARRFPSAFGKGVEVREKYDTFPKEDGEQKSLARTTIEDQKIFELPTVNQITIKVVRSSRDSQTHYAVDMGLDGMREFFRALLKLEEVMQADSQLFPDPRQSLLYWLDQGTPDPLGDIFQNICNELNTGQERKTDSFKNQIRQLYSSLRPMPSAFSKMLIQLVISSQYTLSADECIEMVIGNEKIARQFPTMLHQYPAKLRHSLTTRPPNTTHAVKRATSTHRGARVPARSARMAWQ